MVVREKLENNNGQRAEGRVAGEEEKQGKRCGNKKENFIPSFTFKIIGALGIKGKENKNPIHLAPFMKSPFALPPNHSLRVRKE